MKRALRTLALVALPLGPGCDRATQESPRGVQGQESLAAVVPRAEELSSKGFFYEAATFLGSKVDQLPASERGQASLLLARYYYRANVQDLSLKWAQAAMQEGVGGPEALYLEGECERHLHLPGAESKLERLLKLHPAYLPAQLALARIRMRSSDPALALPLFEAYFKGALPTDNEFKAALLEHGRALRSCGRHQEAADRFVVLLEDDPLDGTLYSELASSLYRLKLRKEGHFVEEIYKLVSQGAFEKHVEKGLGEKGATAFALGQRASNKIREHRFLDAFQSYRKALEIEPLDSRLPVFFADLAFQFRRVREAKEVLDRALRAEMKPASALWWMEGRAFLLEENFPEALRAFRSGIDALAREGDMGGEERGQAPAFSLFLASARSALETGDLPWAATSVEKAAQLSPSSWEPHYWRGRIELHRGSFQGAARLFLEASKRGGQGLADLVYWNALCLEKLDQKAEAFSQLSDVIQSRPGFFAAYGDLARLGAVDPAKSRAIEEASESIKKVQAAIKEGESRVNSLPLEQCGEAYLELGKLYRTLKDPVAFDFFFLAADLLPTNAEACQLILSGLKQSQDVFVKLRFLRRLLEIDPRNDGVLAALVEIYSKLHVRLEEAEALSERLEGIKPSPSARRLRADAALLRGDREKALDLLRRGIEAYPNDSGLREALTKAKD